jgi:uncharacterized protein YukE
LRSCWENQSPIPVLKSSRNTLDGSWHGKSRERFLDSFSSEPGKLDTLASLLEEKAAQIARMTVTVWEWVDVSDRP